MPPPPNPNRLLMIDPCRRLSGVITGGVDPNHCQCKSKSMEDVRTDVEMVSKNWKNTNDINCNYVQSAAVLHSEKYSKFSNRRSMENLLIDTDYSPPLIKKNGKKVWHKE